MNNLIVNFHYLIVLNSFHKKQKIRSPLIDNPLRIDYTDLMIGLNILDIKEFTEKLFRDETFDNFLVTEADFVTSFRVTLNGRKTDFAVGATTGDSLSTKDVDDFVTWSTIRPLAFQIIKGKQLPKGFQIVLKLSKENTAKTVASMGLPFTANDVSGLFLNIRYEDKKIMCITGCSMNTFTMDKSVEKEWDGFIRRFFRHHQISVEEG